MKILAGTHICRSMQWKIQSHGGRDAVSPQGSMAQRSNHRRLSRHQMYDEVGFS